MQKLEDKLNQSRIVFLTKDFDFISGILSNDDMNFDKLLKSNTFQITKPVIYNSKKQTLDPSKYKTQGSQIIVNFEDILLFYFIENYQKHIKMPDISLGEISLQIPGTKRKQKINITGKPLNIEEYDVICSKIIIRDCFISEFSSQKPELNTHRYYKFQFGENLLKTNNGRSFLAINSISMVNLFQYNPNTPLFINSKRTL